MPDKLPNVRLSSNQLIYYQEETTCYMDAELKQHLEDMESRLTSHFESGLSETESRLRAHADEMESRLRAHTSLECEKVETKLLTGFYKWGRTSDLRTRQAMENITVFNERLMALEDRITSLERRTAA